MNAYHSFAQEQRPLLKDSSPGEREKLLSQRWKALSKAEKANYKGCDDTTQTPRRSAYSAFCRAQRPLLPPTLPNATREEVLGQLWAALPERERAAYLVGGSRAPVPVPAPAAPAPAPATASVPLEKNGSEKDGSKNKKAKTAASMVSPSAPENTATPLTAPLAPLTASAPPFLALTAPSSAPTSPTASHSLSTDANDDEYEWEKYLNLDEGFISSSLASLDALQQT